MQLSKSILFAAALGAGNVAGATLRHKHRHADLHEQKRAVGDKVTAVIDGVEVSWENTYDGSNEGKAASAVAPTEPTTTVAAATSATVITSTTATSATAAASSSTATSSNSDEKTTYTEFCNSKKRATNAQILYAGNTGSCGYGSNMMLVSENIADKYDYTVKFTGKNTEDWKVVCWNKIGPDGKTDGWYGHAATEFTLSPGATQYVAFEGNSQGACTAAAGDSIPTDSYGGYAATWFEFDFENESNDKWSGADVSSIQAEAAKLTVQGMHACYQSTCSTIGTAMSAISNAFSNALKLADGLGMNIPAGPASINVVIDY